MTIGPSAAYAAKKEQFERKMAFFSGGELVPPKVSSGKFVSLSTPLGKNWYADELSKCLWQY